jgi:hypothetical protein
MIAVLGKQIRLRSRDRQEAGGGQVGSRNQIMKSENRMQEANCTKLKLKVDVLKQSVVEVWK